MITKKKIEKDLIICTPHAMHARNLFSSSFNFKSTSLILGNFSTKTKKYLRNKTSSDIKSFNFIHLLQSKFISMYTLIIDIENNNKNKNTFINLLKKNYDNCDLDFKKSFRHKLDNKYNKFFLVLNKLLLTKYLLFFFIVFTSIIIYLSVLVKYKPKKILFMCSNSFIDKGLLFISKFFNIKTYGLISSWDHLVTKRFVDINKFEKLFIWNDYFKNELKKIYNYDIKKVKTIGLPYYDTKRKKFKEQNFLTFFMPNTSMMKLSKQYDVINFLQKFCKINRFKLYVKPHPGLNYNDLSKFKKFNEIKFIIPKEISMNLNRRVDSKIFIDEELDMIIQKSKVIINFHSTTSLDSIYHLKPVINLSLVKKDNWLYKIPYYKYILDFNAISVVTNLKDLEIELKKYIKNPKYKKEKIKNLKNKYFGKFNPLSGKLMFKNIYKN